MFFLLRMAFWIGLVLVLLPSDRPANEATATQVNAGDAISAASAAVSDMSQFCTRQPAACAVGGQAATVIGQRAQAGARKLYHIITEKKGDHTGSIGETAAASLPGAFDTLSSADRQIDWHGLIPPTEPGAPEASADRG
jgi:hypothetical protein